MTFYGTSNREGKVGGLGEEKRTSQKEMSSSFGPGVLLSLPINSASPHSEEPILVTVSRENIFREQA